MLDLSHIFEAYPALETERLILRQPVMGDVDDLFTVMGDARVATYLGHPPMANRDEAVARIERFERNFREQSAIAWGMTLKEHGRLIGTCLLWNLNTAHHSAELGYILHPALWGKGIATEAARAAIRYGFERMNLHSIEAQIDPENEASRGLLLKIGFVQEGYFRENFYEESKGRYTDTAVFGLLRGDWLPPEAKAYG